MRFTKNLLAIAFLAALPMMASAESQFSTTPAANTTAVARLDFRVIIPEFLYLRIGNGPAAPAFLPDDTTQNLLTFNVLAPNVGNGTAVASTGGDLAAGASVTARLIGNGGPINLNSTTLGAMNTGVVTETISFSQISNVATALTAAGLLAHPTLVDGGTGTTIAVPVTSGTKVTNRDATWTFSYANALGVIPAAGTYGGAGTNNGRVTYTATMP